MAVDTRDKRFSMVGLANQFIPVFPNPDGTIDAADRFQYIHLYHDASLVPAPAIGERKMRRMPLKHMRDRRRA